MSVYIRHFYAVTTWVAAAVWCGQGVGGAEISACWIQSARACLRMSTLKGSERQRLGKALKAEALKGFERQRLEGFARQRL